jgi:uncharacterized membrane protein
MASPANPRLSGLDVFRGWAIVLMIVFHFTYDLALFRFIDVNLAQDTFWVGFRYVIVSIFMVSVGVSLGLVHAENIRWNRVGHRALILGAAAAIVTIATRIQAPQMWVYFGILHLVWVASLVGVLFLGRPWLALIVALVIFVGSHDHGPLWQFQHLLYLWLRHPLHLPHMTEDLARFFPWFGAVLIGSAAHDLDWYRYFFSMPVLAAANRFNRTLAFLGRHALVIYLVHLPVLFGMVMSGKYLLAR